MILYKASLVQGIIHSHLANAQVHQATRQQLTIDVVTGVLSRRGFEEKLESQFLLARRYGGAFCVAMLDLDQFKAVNDRLGHAAGDKALQTLAQVITEEKRQTDVLCRFGGDEFVLLLPHTDRSAAAVVLERIRKRILAAPIVPDQPVSISGGLAQFEGHETDSANELLRRADLAMYRAKQGGRNRVEMWRKNREEDPRWIDPRRVQNLQARVQRLSQRSQEIFLQSVWGLVQTVEARDPYTRSHSDNVTRYAVALATARGLPGGDVDVIRRAGMVHDIGKIGVPDTILRKPRRLTASELQIMQQHPLIAVQILGEMKFLDREMRLVRSHHERWDGQGYPDGIAHNAIPFGARLLAVADAFDAITSNRVYRTSRSVADAVQILQDSSGTQFDPEAVEILQKVIDAAGRKRPHAGDLTSTHILAHLGPQ